MIQRPWLQVTGDRPAILLAMMQRILIVDDDTAIVRMLERTLRAEGFETATAADGGAALAKAETWPPDLIVLDRLMPGLDGLAVARRLRSKGDAVPVLMLTAAAAAICQRSFQRLTPAP